MRAVGVLDCLDRDLRAVKVRPRVAMSHGAYYSGLQHEQELFSLSLCRGMRFATLEYSIGKSLKMINMAEA